MHAINKINREIAELTRQAGIARDIHGRQSAQYQRKRLQIADARNALHNAKCDAVGRHNIIGVMA